MNSKISLGIKDNLLVIIAQGEIRARSCFALKKFLYPFLEKTKKSIRIFMDLSHCIYMDSTFIGFIIGLTMKCYEHRPEEVNVINPSSECRKDLEKLSCLEKLKLIKLDTIPEIPTFDLDSDEYIGDDLENLETVFKSHNLLSQLSEENRLQFSSLLNELRNVLVNYN